MKALGGSPVRGGPVSAARGRARGIRVTPYQPSRVSSTQHASQRRPSPGGVSGRDVKAVTLPIVPAR
ncbi:hypothetical protein GCM10008937_30290 [Deinococcus depolymerans]|uniref:Uncharacterized protein n=1 Tax=Deinococcus depolymerans TaxID=392408 RepID=A0ABN1CK19_9DEIO